MIRDYQKIKTLSDFNTLDEPHMVRVESPGSCPLPTQNVLRVLVRPKYGKFVVPPYLVWLVSSLFDLSEYDEKLTGIKDSWCYVTVRRGLCEFGDDSWHFDGASFRTDTIPERNYLWCDHTPTQYRRGSLEFPSDFDPLRHNLHSFADSRVDEKVYDCLKKKWYLFLPFCLHRRNPVMKPKKRTLIRVSFLDVEIRDVNNTINPYLETPAFGRDSVKDFRNKLIEY